ncbi:protein PAXX isoform X3 [Apus apus]|uniref:protein PAXX isoform X3 n=1 Tax=Apus apus TaxID=8895 RepID=UPI0021F91CE9|nr:protein PAXX isoform X3 [Apus apus]
MAEPAGPFQLLRAGPGRYLCYCRGGTVYVTDALQVWAGELGARPPLGCVRTAPGMGPAQAVSGRAPSPQRCQPEEQAAQLRAALGRGAAALSLGPGKATLQLREEEAAAQCSALDLFKLPVAEARSQLQALVFGMAGRIESLERRLEVVETLASSCSPEKNTAQSQQLFRPDPSPQKSRGARSALPAKRKIPGESLINPGFKSKKAPSGVDFEDF